MSRYINIYAADADDFDCEGLCVLTPSEWTHHEEANGESVLEMTHPKDAEGRWKYIQKYCILRADVPVATLPEISGGAYVATAEQWTVKTTATKADRYQYTKATKGRKSKCIPGGTTVTVVQKGDERYKIKTGKYGTGWIAIDALDMKIKDVPYSTNQEVNAATPAEQVRPQLFRIRDVTWRENGDVEVEAWHITYDLEGILTDVVATGSVTGVNWLKATMNNTLVEHEFTAATDIADARTGVELRNESVIFALMDSEDGFIGRYGGEILRDNYEIEILHRAGMDRGLWVEYRKNLTGIECSVEHGEVTAIVPVGQTKDGDDLYLSGTRYIAAPDVSYPIHNMVKLDVSDAKVDKNVSTSLARQRMKAAVQEEWDNGAHHPSVTLKVEFALLGQTEEYKTFKDLERCCLYDTVHVYHPDIGLIADKVISRTWNGMKQCFDEIELGAADATLNSVTISNSQLSSGINGAKISSGTVGAAQMSDECITARHLQAESVSAEAIQAEAVTAEKIAAGAITADKLDATTIDAKVADIVVANLTTANIEKANIDWASVVTLTAAVADIAQANLTTANIEKANIDWASVATLNAAIASIAQAKIDNATISTAQIENLTAEIVKALHAEIEVGSFSLAEVKNLLANALILQQGVADSMMITNLSVTSANLLNATIGELVLKGTDGKYYRVIVGSDGTIQTEQTTVTDEEISAGETTDGHAIVTTTANIQDLSAQTVKASQAVINTIMTESLTAGKITAGEALIASATIPALYTTSIEAIGNSLTFSANEKIQSIVGELDETTLIAQDASDSASNALALAEETQEGLTTVEAAAKAAQEAANTNAAGLKNLQTTVTQTQEGLSVVRTEQTNLEGRVTTIESGVHIEGSEIGIYASDSPFQNKITNTGWTITENDMPVITCAGTKLSAPRVQINDALMIGGLAIRPSSDKHVRVLKYGK